MKRILVVFLCVLMCVSFYPKAFAVNSGEERDIGCETSLAMQLKELGLFQGVTENEDGTPSFELSREPTRLEALIMLVYAIGKGSEAKEYPKTHPFTDVPAWADGYVSYAYHNGLTKGSSDTLFDAESAASAEIYLTYMLRALGYSDGEYKEFTWDAPWALAAWCGILPTQVIKTDFLRADVVDITCAALYATIKGTQTTLHERLVSEGAFTKKEFQTAFPEDPFADFRLIDDRISDVIAEREPLGLLKYNTFAAECHIVTDIEEANGLLTVSALVCYCTATLDKYSHAIESSEKTIDLWLIELDADTFKLKSCRTGEALLAEGLPLKKFFANKTLAARDLLSVRMTNVCEMETRMQIGSELFGRRGKSPTYEEGLATQTAAFSSVTQKLETDTCTLLLCWIESNGPCAYLCLIYKPGSALGEGEAVLLPMPRDNDKGISYEPDYLWLSEDSLTLHYSYHFDERLVSNEGLPSEKILHEAGTYNYTVDLSTGVTSLNILSD